MPYTRKDDFNLFLYQLRKDSRLTTEQFCKMLGITRMTFNRWLRDPGVIPFRSVLLMSGVLQVDLYRLVYGLYKNKTGKGGRDVFELGELKARLINEGLIAG